MQIRANVYKRESLLHNRKSFANVASNEGRADWLAMAGLCCIPSSDLKKTLAAWNRIRLAFFGENLFGSALFANFVAKFKIEVLMTFEEMYALACQRKKEMPEGKGTTELFKKGPHGIGKKLVEEAAESWMAARFESHDAQCLELSQVLYYVAVMMAEKGIKLEEVYAKL